MTDPLEKLAGAGIHLLPAVEIATHFVFERDGFVALVERREAGFGAIGAAGMLTEHGIAMLVRRGEQEYFVAKGWQEAATPERAASLRRFSADLEAALS